MKDREEKKEKLKKEVEELNRSLRRANTPNELYYVFKCYKSVTEQYSDIIGEYFNEGDDYIETDIESAMKSKKGKRSDAFIRASNDLSKLINEIPI